MTEKRYAIVRVNTGACPDRFENIKNEKVCYVHRKKEFCRDENLICTKCYYGDTKEQLVLKIAQVIFKKRNDFGDKWRNKIWTEADIRYSYKLAKKIVEFLGVIE